MMLVQILLASGSLGSDVLVSKTLGSNSRPLRRKVDSSLKFMQVMTLGTHKSYPGANVWRIKWCLTKIWKLFSLLPCPLIHSPPSSLSFIYCLLLPLLTPFYASLHPPLSSPCFGLSSPLPLLVCLLSTISSPLPLPSLSVLSHLCTYPLSIASSLSSLPCPFHQLSPFDYSSFIYFLPCHTLSSTFPLFTASSPPTIHRPITFAILYTLHS